MGYIGEMPRANWTFVAAALLTLAATGAWAGVGVANASERTTLDRQLSTLGTSTGVSTLQVEALGSEGLDPRSVRSVGKFESYHFYAAADAMHNLCLIVEDARSGSAASTCLPPGEFESGPVALGLWTRAAGGVEAYAVPDSFASIEAPSGWTRVSPHLLAIGMDEPSESIETITSRDGEVWELHRQESHEDGGPQLGAD